MNNKTEAPPLISLTIRSIKDHPFPMAIFPRPQQAVIVGKSTRRDLSFDFATGPLNPEQTRRCRLLQQHGSTIVEFTNENHFFGWNQERWQESIIVGAMEKMASLYPESQEAKDLSAYHPDFARNVLEVAANNFPRQTDMVELKHALTPEPSDEELFTAIDALTVISKRRRCVAIPTIKYRMWRTSGPLGSVERNLRDNPRREKRLVEPSSTAK